MIKRKRAQKIKTIILVLFSVFLIFTGAFFIWMASLKIPDVSGFELRNIAQSTKIYASDGKTLLFDVHKDIRRTYISLDRISRNLINATIAIEDSEFYNHKGIRPKAILRAVFTNIFAGTYKQGGSTITQQLVKNTLLSREKTITRKVKEWVLALKIEKKFSKDKILELYLNEAPYGGNILGAEEASRRFFNKSASELNLAEAAYLAALPKAPSYYSPYGKHKDALEKRKNIVLDRMLELGFIDEEEYRIAKNEKVEFQKIEEQNIKAPHFVFFTIDWLKNKFGEEAIYTGGLKVVSSLDYELQKKAQEIVSRFAYENEEKFNAENAGLVAIEPKTGAILAMVGSRNYFDDKIDGKYNIATALRQPGSTFKPIIYSKAFESGYTPSTVLFDVPTQFSANCAPSDFSNDNQCYSPKNYDNKFRGPMTIRDALAQSINIPAVKTLYLIGLDKALENAKNLGISSLNKKASHYGLSLVLGGGEVSLLELTNAYATFANAGEFVKYTPVLEVRDSKGNILFKHEPESKRVLDKNATLLLTDVLSDNNARAPAYGRRSFLYFANQDVAAKTGTTNDFRDVWVIGYTPKIAVGTWAGNNDNRPIVKKVAGFVIAPMWRAFMDEALKLYGGGSFEEPEKPNTNKPIFDGVWFYPEMNPPVHSILYWVDRDNPQGPRPANPYKDPLYNHFEFGVQSWLANNLNIIPTNTNMQNSQNTQMVNSSPTNNANNAPFEIISPRDGQNIKAGIPYKVEVQIYNKDIKAVKYYLNGVYLGSISAPPYSIIFVPQKGQNIQQLTAKAVGKFGEEYAQVVNFYVR